MKLAQVDDYDSMELAAHILGVTHQYENADDPLDFIDSELYEKFEITSDTFCEIIRHLLPLVTVAPSGLTGKLYRGFGGNGSWLVKEEIKGG